GGRPSPESLMPAGLVARVRTPERMDDPGLDPAAHRHALAGLARLNAWGRAAAVLFPPLRDLARPLGRPLRVLDVATGSGDVPRQLRDRATRDGLEFRIDACDISPVAVDHATRTNEGIRYF